MFFDVKQLIFDVLDLFQLDFPIRSTDHCHYKRLSIAKVSLIIDFVKTGA